jgi:hypothetical protein
MIERRTACVAEIILEQAMQYQRLAHDFSTCMHNSSKNNGHIAAVLFADEISGAQPAGAGGVNDAAWTCLCLQIPSFGGYYLIGHGDSLSKISIATKATR